jgi:hypothetical protein
LNNYGPRSTQARILVDVHALIVWALLTVSAAAPAQTAERLPEWTLNLAKSTFDPGPPPRSAITTLFTAGRYVKVISKTVDANGKLNIVEYRVAPDGLDVPVTGSPVYDSLSVRPIDADTSRATRKKHGKVVQITIRVMSADRSTMTFTTTGTDEHGKPIHDVQVFEKK